MGAESTIQLIVGERADGESAKAVQACNDYLRMGPGRGLIELYRVYTNVDNQSQFKPPTTVYATIRQWSSKFNWPARADEYDLGWEEIKNEERRRVFEYGLALDFERVRVLHRLAETLERELYETDEKGGQGKLWLKDVKQIGSGETAERIDLRRFNSQLVSELRSTLDDIAKETGGRVNKSDVSLSGDVNMKGYVIVSPDDWDDQETEAN